MATTGGKTGVMPEFMPLTFDEPGYSTDNPADTSTPANISSQSMSYRLASRAKSWSTMDLAVDLQLGPQSALDAITNRVGGYWAFDRQARIINSMRGIVADNIANDSSDMINNIATDAAGTPAAAELVSADAILDAQQTIGDKQATSFGAIAMHSVVYNRLRKQQQIDFIRDADNNTLFSTFQGMRVVVSDHLPAISGTNRINYHTYLFGTALIGAGSGRLSNPTAVERKEDAGNGAGQEILYSRQSDVLHPYGFTWTDTTVAGDFPTYAELALAANWSRVRERKNIPFAVLITNG